MTDLPSQPTKSDRYARQVRYAELGPAGQARLAAARVAVCGCGALGSTAVNLLARAGVGYLRLIDRDLVDLTNLHRQVLFDEADAASGTPKAVAATNKLRVINSEITVEPVVADLTSRNIEQLCGGVDLILDGTDNFETRFLINDFAVARGLPWVYGGCVGTAGQALAIVPGQSPCLSCLIPECPAPGSTPTCDTVGVLGPAVGLIASYQAMEAIKIASGQTKAVAQHLLVVDLWSNRVRMIDLSGLRGQGQTNCTADSQVLESLHEDERPTQAGQRLPGGSSQRQANLPPCVTCGQRKFPWLEGRSGSQTAVLCGRNAVQLTFPDRAQIDLVELAERMRSLGTVSANPFLVRLKLADHELSVFADGRAIVSGTDDVAVAKTLYAQCVGH